MRHKVKAQIVLEAEQTALYRLFREVEDGCRRLIDLANSGYSKPMFWDMDCEGTARRLRILADKIDDLKND